ncbi:rod shape-determining protein RodA [soil metagenome]
MNEPAADRRMDWVLLAAVGGLIAFSTVLVWSATKSDPQGWIGRQMVAAMIGLGLMVLVWGADPRWIRRLAPIGYLLTVALLLVVLASGSVVNGSQSWLILGPMSVQPSEFAKLAVVAMIGLIAAQTTPAASSWTSTLARHRVPMMLGVAAVPAALVFAQPDLGTLSILAIVVFATLVVAGAAKKWLFGLAAAAVTAGWLVVSSGLLAQYQVDRLLAFLDPSLDPKGAGYNVTQARIAVGNGGLWGQGLFEGSQTQAGFVPEQHTDFVFTVAAEELGLMGSGLLVLLVGIVVWRALRIARNSHDLFGRVVGVGIGCWIGVQAFWNVGMCLGIMPVTGVPLPLVSYGGTAMIATLIGIGVLLNIDARASEQIVAPDDVRGHLEPAPAGVRRGVRAAAT